MSAGMMQWIWFAVASTAGGMARVGIRMFMVARWGHEWPLPTFFANIFGCFLIGLFDAWTARKTGMPSEMRLLLMTGFCGAFTTFSALIYEISAYEKQGRWGHSLIYLTVSVIVGFSLFRVGEWLGHHT